MLTNFTVLLIESCPASLQGVLAYLEPDTKWRQATTPEEYAAQLTPNVACILADYAAFTPDLRALLQQRVWDIPVIVAGGSIGEEAAVECLKLGAADYVHQDHLARLSTAIQRALQEKAKRAKQRQNEAALRVNEARYRAIVEDQIELVARIKPDMTLNFVNEAYCRYFGKSYESLVGRSFRPLVPDEDMQSIRSYVASLGRDKLTAVNESRIIRADGATRIIQWIDRVILDEFDQVIEIQAVGRDITEIKQAEEQLRYQSTVLQNISDAVISLNIDFTIRSWNKAAERTYGWRAEEVIGQSYIDLVYPEDAWGVLQQVVMPHLLETGRWEGEVIERRRDGEMLDTYTTATLLRDETGQPIGLVSINQDMTERHRAEAALHAHQERTRRMTDTAPVMIWIAGLSGQCEFVNKAWLTFTGRAFEQEIGVGWLQGIQADYLLRCSVIWMAAFREQKPFQLEYPQRRADGEYRWVLNNGAPWFDASGQFLGYVGSCVDITDRKKVEAALSELNVDLEARVAARTAELEKRQAQLTAVLNAIGEGVSYTENSLIQYANPALAAITDYSVDELIGQHGTTLLKPSASDAERAQITAWIESRVFADLNKPWRGEAPLFRKDGSSFEAALTITPINDPHQSPTSAVTVIRDITAEKQLQAQKNRFIANASHELRTPLTSVRTRLYLLGKQPDRAKEHLAVLERATERMTRLIEDLLDTTRFERGVIALQRGDVILQSLMQDVLQWQQPEADRKRITLAAELPAEPVHIFADLDRIGQVVMNLTVNAINYTPEGGHVTLRVWTESGTDTGAEANTTPSAIICIQDDGIGISPQNLARVFEPFFRANEMASLGTGLGLSIAKEIVELHGSQLVVESEIGKGSAFKFKLACTQASKPLVS